MTKSALIGCRALVVEDEALICMLLEDMLADIGCTVIGTAAGVTGALALVEKADFDFAILDVNLGRERSYPVADALLELGIPFLFSTGYDNLLEGHETLPRLQKPYKQTELANVISTILVKSGNQEK